jgi:hypothetical protein
VFDQTISDEGDGKESRDEDSPTHELAYRATLEPKKEQGAPDKRPANMREGTNGETSSPRTESLPLISACARLQKF